MRSRLAPVALLEALMLAWPAVAQAAPLETVFDFRPRIERPASAVAGGTAASASESRVHLHVFDQPQGSHDCNGNERQPVGQLREDRQPAQVGVVLSGGISKGLAFLGALQVLDDTGIRIDSIAGTSMGAVIGAFYAAGYAPTDLFAAADGSDRVPQFRKDILGRIDWHTMFTDVPDPRVLTINQQTAWGLGEGTLALPRVYQGGLRSGQNLSAFLGKYLLPATAVANGCFDNLYVPFRAKATDVTNGLSLTLRRGELATAVRASLSFPILFTPTPLRGARLMDGGLLSNYPVDAITERAESRSPAPPPSAAASPASAAASTPYRVLIGVDVSDTNAPPMPQPRTFQLLSLFGAISSVNDGIGTAISRDTRLQREQQDDCTQSYGEWSRPPFPGRPCLLHVKVERDGGFTDFAPSQIAAFVQSGRDEMVSALCRWFTQAPGPACLARAKVRDAGDGRLWRSMTWQKRLELDTPAIQEVRELLKRHQHWGFLLHNPRGSFDEAVRSLGEKGRPLQKRPLMAMHGWLADESRREAPPSLPRVWAQAVEGLEIERDEAGVVRLLESPLVQQEPTLRRELLAAARQSACWMLDADCPSLRPGEAAPLPDWRRISGVRVTHWGTSVRIRVSSWVYTVRGLVITRGLTESDHLDDVRIAAWSVKPPALAEHLAQLVDQSDGTRRLRRRMGEPALDCLEGETKAPSVTCGWKSEIAKALMGEGLQGRAFDVRYFENERSDCGADSDCTPRTSLGRRFESLQERYYANAASEYFRIQGVRGEYLEIGEKDTHRAEHGAVHLGYLYDYRNKHSFGMRYVHETREAGWYKPVRTIVSGMVNEPASSSGDGMAAVDASLLYLPRIDKRVPDFSLNAHAARRVQRIGKTDRALTYDDLGWHVIVALRADDTDRNGGRINLADRWSPYLGLSVRRVGDVRSGDIEGVRQQLQDPGLGPDWRRFESLSGGFRVARQRARSTATGQAEVAVHRANGAWHREVLLDFTAEQARSYEADAALMGLRVVLGRIWTQGDDGPAGRPAAPLDELYSLGGHYPLADRRVWGRKRIDYLGADLNERWGSELEMIEGRCSLMRLPAITYFAPFSKLQLDFVMQRARVGFERDASKGWRTASGLVASAYIPSISALKLRGTAALGGESLKRARFFSSVEILF